MSTRKQYGDEEARVSECVRVIRESRGKTQAEVARAIGMNRTSYVLMEQGRRKVMALDLAALAEYYSVPYESLFNWVEAPK